MDALTKTDNRAFFEGRDYGKGLAAITIVFLCQKPERGLKRRIRLSKPERKLYMDIVLDLSQLKMASDQERKGIVLAHLLNEIPAVLGKYKTVEFDAPSFMSDLEQQIAGVRQGRF